MQQSDLSVQPRKPIYAFCANIIELPIVSTVINTGFLNSLYTVTDDKVWMGGQSHILKLFDLQGNIQLTLKIPCRNRLYICVHNGQVVFSDTPS